MRHLEISDLIVDFDPVTLSRRPVRKRDVVEHLRNAGDVKAAEIVESFPERNGVLDPLAVDRELLLAHQELQQMSEEFFHGQRAYELLRSVVTALRRGGAPEPIRIVDVGCGIGYVIRWLAARTEFAAEVELIGVDFNRAFVDAAAQLAATEELRCRFVVGNAFHLEEATSIFLSTGVIHHFRDSALDQFFAAHDQPEALAFAHFDFQPNWFAPIGSWLFHLVRMRRPLARHDGVVSATRAHSADTLVAAARDGAPGFVTRMYGQQWGRLPVPRVMQTVMGIRPAYHELLIEALGSRASRLGALS